MTVFDCNLLYLSFDISQCAFDLLFALDFSGNGVFGFALDSTFVCAVLE